MPKPSKRQNAELHASIHIVRRWKQSDGARRKAAVTFQHEWRQCNNERCAPRGRCHFHGPYWYAYWKETGRTRSRYIGRALPKYVVAEFRAAASDEREIELEAARVTRDRKRS